MVKVKYEIERYQDHYRLYVVTETYDEKNKMGGCGCDVIMAGSREACLKRKEELENEEKDKQKTQ